MFDVKFCEDSPALLGAGGAKGKLGIWNTLEVEEMQKRMPHANAALDEDGRVLGGALAGMGAMDVNTDSDASDDDAPNAERAQAAHSDDDSGEEDAVQNSSQPASHRLAKLSTEQKRATKKKIKVKPKVRPKQ